MACYISDTNLANKNNIIIGAELQEDHQMSPNSEKENVNQCGSKPEPCKKRVHPCAVQMALENVFHHVSSLLRTQVSNEAHVHLMNTPY